MILQKHRKMENIYNKKKKVECYQLKRKNRIPDQNVIQKAFELSGITRTLEKSQPLAWKCLQRPPNKDFTLTFKAVTVIGCLCFQFIVNGKS